MPVFVPKKEWLADLEEQARRRLQDTMGGLSSAGQEAITGAQGQIDQAANAAAQAKEQFARDALERAMAPIREAGAQAAQGLQNLGQPTEEQLATQRQREEEARQRQETEERQRRQAQEAFQQGPVGQAFQGVGERFSDLGTGARDLQEQLGRGFESAQQAQAGMEQTAGETTERERGQTYQQPGEELPGTGGWVAPESGTPEGERELGRLADIATEYTPGARVITAMAREAAPIGPITADTPLPEAALGLGQLAMVPWNVSQTAARGVMEAIPGGGDVPEWAKDRGITRDTPVLGGALTPDVGLPMAAGLAAGSPEEWARVAGVAGRGTDDLLRAAGRFRPPGGGTALERVSAALRGLLPRVPSAEPEVALAGVGDELGRLGRLSGDDPGDLAGPVVSRAVPGEEGLSPSLRDALRRARAAGTPPPPEVEEALARTAAGREAEAAAARVAAAQEEALAAARAGAAGTAGTAGTGEGVKSFEEEFAEQGRGAYPPRIARANSPTALGRGLEVFNNWTLGGPLTLGANLSGGAVGTLQNLLEATAQRPGRPGLGALDFARGAAGSVPEGLRAAGRTFWQGTEAASAPLSQGTRALAPGGRSSLAAQPVTATPGGIGALLGSWATRANAATDQLFYTLNEAGARSVGESLGYTGTTLDDFAKRAAEEATFSGDPSRLGKFVIEAQRAVSNPAASAGDRLFGAAVTAFAPFVRVPERILRQGLDLATGGAVHVPEVFRSYLDKSLSPTEADVLRRQAGGRIFAAVTTTAGLIGAAANGTVTGDGPDDPRERERLMNAVDDNGDPLWRPRSFWVPLPGADGVVRGHWIPQRYFGAFGEQAALIGNVMEAYQKQAKASGDPRPTPELLADVGKTVANEVMASVLDDSWARDLGRFVTAVQQRRGAERLGSTAAGFLARPLAFVAPLARGLDPYARQVGDAPWERAQERLPGLRQLLPARIDPTTGLPVEEPAGILEEYLGSAGSGGAQGGRRASALAKELARLQTEGDLGVNVRDYNVESEYAGLAQTPEARAKLRTVLGTSVDEVVGRKLLSSQRYRGATDEEKARLLRRGLQDAYDLADARLSDADVRRDPERAARHEYAAVPKFVGVEGTPETIRRRNLEIAWAKRTAQEYRDKYGAATWRTRIDQEEPEAYRLSLTPEVPAPIVRDAREKIERRFGVTLG